MSDNPRPISDGPTESTSALVPTTAYTVQASPGSRMVADVVVTPTQVRRPWRSTVRTIFQGAVGFASIAPVVAVGIYQTDNAGDYPAAVAQALVISGAVTRVMAIPGVESWLRRFLPFLAAAPAPAKEA